MDRTRLTGMSTSNRLVIDSKSRYSANVGGFTLIEVAVVTGIMAVVFMLVIPAALSSLEAARASRCRNNLRQISLAIAGYHAIHDAFTSISAPPIYGRGAANPPVIAFKQYSFYCKILPNLDMPILFDSINFNAACQDAYQFGDPPGFMSNTTAFGTQVDSFLCPSDKVARGYNRFGKVSYRANMGLRAWCSLKPTNDAGPMHCCSPTDYAGVRDGTSNTILLSERIVGEEGPSSASEALVFSRDRSLVGDYSLDRMINACPRGLAASTPPFSSAGLAWPFGTLGHTAYNQILAPNSSLMDCQPMLSNPMTAVVTARSYHANFVNCARADGSVASIKETINILVWRSLGTRSGGEAISSEAY